MFEGHINKQLFRDPADRADLRQFRWTDLVAKIAATRDLREEMDRIEGGFEAFGEARRETPQESKPTVNHDDLSRGKDTGLSLGNAASDAVQGERKK